MKDFLMSGAVASREDSTVDSWRTAGGSPRSSQWFRHWPAIVLVATALAVGWKFHSSRSNFPRRESEFLSSSAIDRRLDKLTKRLHDDPDDLSAMVESGILLFQKGHDYYPDAVNELHDAWSNGALDVRIFYYTGIMYQQLGLYPQAVEEYEMFLRNKPDDDEVRLLLAKLLYQSGREKDHEKDMEDATDQYQQLRKRLPRNPIVAENLALCLQSLKKFDEAKQELAALMRFGPEEARRAHLYLAQIATDEGDAREAMREYLQVLPLEGRPDLGTPAAAIYAAIAENYDQLKAPAMAEDFWEKTVQLDPKNRKAQTRLSVLKKQLAKKKPARSRRR